MKLLITIVAVVIAGLLFTGCYVLNHKTPKPEGCEQSLEDCSSCNNLNCSIKAKGEK